MDRATAAIDAFAQLVERAESSTADQPRAELARFQLQALTGTLGALADGPRPDDVETALAVLRAHVASLGGDVDREQGREMRTKVEAYVVLADDLGLDRARLEQLLRRWDALDGSRDTPRRARRAKPSTTGTSPCPVCGLEFKRVTKHMSVAHRDEWERQRSEH
jgi:hypothetical protein